MIRHIVLLRWKNGATASQVGAVTDGFRRLQKEIREMKGSFFGEDAGLYRGNEDYVFVAEFETEDEFRTYVKHPLHQEFMSEIVGPILESYSTAQIRHPRG